MIAPDLTVPEALVVTLGPELHPILVTAGVLAELELRGALRCSDPEAEHFGTPVQTSRFRLEIREMVRTGDELLDATLTKAQGLIGYGANVVGPDAINRRLQSVQLRKSYIDRLGARGQSAGPPGSRGLLRRRAKAAESPDERAALRDGLLTVLLEAEPAAVDPADRALIALVAVSEGRSTLGRPLWALVVGDGRTGTDARSRERTRVRVIERAGELVDALPLAQAVSLALADRPAGMDVLR